VDTSVEAAGIGRRRRRRHSAAFKAEAVAACRRPGVSIAAVALSRGLNANLLRRWVVEAERTGALAVAEGPVAPGEPAEHTAGFVPVALPSRTTDAPIRIKIRRGPSSVSVEWPASAAHECALLLRELMR
jgi:transposase-like protein